MREPALRWRRWNPTPPSKPPALFNGKCTRGPRPDTHCTPGVAARGVTADDVCTPGYSRRVRNVSQSEKNRVYAEYGIRRHTPGAYEVDHLISLELGGSNSIKNLWPEKQPGARSKDKLENSLHGDVCDGTISLRTAQKQIVQLVARCEVMRHADPYPVSPPWWRLATHSVPRRCCRRRGRALR